MGRSPALTLATLATSEVLDEAEAGDDFDEGVHVGGDGVVALAGSDDLEEVDDFATFGCWCKEQCLHLGEWSP